MNNARNRREPRAYVRSGYAKPVKDKMANKHSHLVRGCVRVVDRAREGNGVASFSVAYHTSEQLSEALAWMKDTGEPQYLKGWDVSLFTDTTESEGRTLPRMWVQVILNR